MLEQYDSIQRFAKKHPEKLAQLTEPKPELRQLAEQLCRDLLDSCQMNVAKKRSGSQ